MSYFSLLGLRPRRRDYYIIGCYEVARIVSLNLIDHTNATETLLYGDNVAPIVAAPWSKNDLVKSSLR